MLDRILSQTTQLIDGFWEEAGEAIAEGAEKAKEAATDVINLSGRDLQKGVNEGADAIFDSLAMADSALDEGVKGTFSNLFAGRFANALEAPAQALDKIVFGIPRRLMTGIYDVQRRLFDAGTRILGPSLGGTVRSIGHALLDVGRTFTMTLGESVRDVIRIPGEIVFGTVRHGENAIKLAIAGNGWGALSEFVQLGFQPFRSALGTMVDVNIRVLHGVVSSIGTLIGRGPTRGLTEDEKATLREVYGDSIDLDSIRVRRNDLSHELGIRTHAVGNTIYMSAENYDSNVT